MAELDKIDFSLPVYAKLQTVVKIRQMVLRLWGLDVWMSDAKGNVTDPHWGQVFAGKNAFLTNALSDPAGLRDFHVSLKKWARKITLPEESTPLMWTEPTSGFQFLAVPIWIEDQVMGSLFVGGFFDSPPTSEEEDRIRQSASIYHGADLKDEDAAFLEIPVLQETEIHSLNEMLRFAAEEVSRFHSERADRRATFFGGGGESQLPFSFHSIVGRSPAMQLLYDLLEKLQDSESSVLIQGENGTGKEMVAKTIHYNSPRKDLPFITQNCSALNDNLLDSELFGHVKGSFTGAIRDKKGLFEVADGGTFFMDEIGDMSPALQVKLLRVLQEGVYVPVGGTEPRSVNVRILAATNRNLRDMIEEGTFREDLYYRINVINLQVPALRERREDISLLADHFLKKYCQDRPNAQKYLSTDALDCFMAYNWPGNVRQLENEVQRAIVMSGAGRQIEKAALSPAVTLASEGTLQVKLNGKLKDTMEQMERQILLEGLRKAKWNKSKLSRELGISRATLIWKIQKYGLVQDGHV